MRVPKPATQAVGWFDASLSCSSEQVSCCVSEDVVKFACAPVGQSMKVSHRQCDQGGPIKQMS